MANNSGSGGGGLMGAFPMIAIVVIIYNILAFTAPMFTGGTDANGDTIAAVDALLASGFTVPLISGDTWKITVGDGLLVLGLIMLFQEVVRATSSSATSVANHALSMILFVVAIVEFIVLQGFGTSVFFLITLMALFDVVAGFTVSIVSARRDFGGGGVPIVGDN